MISDEIFPLYLLSDQATYTPPVIRYCTIFIPFVSSYQHGVITILKNIVLRQNRKVEPRELSNIRQTQINKILPSRLRSSTLPDVFNDRDVSSQCLHLTRWMKKQEKILHNYANKQYVLDLGPIWSAIEY